MFKSLAIIINPISGQKTDVIPVIKKELQDKNIAYTIEKTTKSGDVKTFTQKAVNENIDAIAVYGGDGTVMEAVQVLSHTHTPLIILPGGTANIMAKELKIPLVVNEAVKQLTYPNPQVYSVDVGLFNTIPFVLRVNIGVLADMIVEANRDLKNNFGILAYGITAFQSFANATPTHYTIHLENEVIETQGISIVIANSGNIGLPGLSFLPQIKIDDGLLDILLIKKSDLGYLASIAANALINREEHDELKHWQVKQARIVINSQQNTICDDAKYFCNEVDIKILPQALKVIMPQNDA